MRAFATIALLGTANAIQLHSGEYAAIHRDIDEDAARVIGNFLTPLVDLHKDKSLYDGWYGESEVEDFLTPFC